MLLICMTAFDAQLENITWLVQTSSGFLRQLDYCKQVYWNYKFTFYKRKVVSNLHSGTENLEEQIFVLSTQVW